MGSMFAGMLTVVVVVVAVKVEHIVKGARTSVGVSSKADTVFVVVLEQAKVQSSCCCCWAGSLR